MDLNKFGTCENANYNKIFKNSFGILHLASPFKYKYNDPVNDIIKPAVTGNLRVLESAKNIDTIKKIILTSSSAAIVDLEKKKPIYNENDWNDSSSKTKNAYNYSKFLSEKCAWEFKSKFSKDINYELISINPAFVIGPTDFRPNQLNQSMQLFRDALLGIAEPAVSNRYMGWIDLRNVVESHINALESKDNLDYQRYLMSPNVYTLSELVEIAKKLFPQYDIKSLPKPKDNNTSMNQPHKYNVLSISKFKLNHYIDINTTIKDTINYLIENNYYNPKFISMNKFIIKNLNQRDNIF
ncbi:hypothetical protein ACTA71_007424 [Dictyostelium dimigraforme]